nr:MAG TPA: hypothetical protein [Caudoviricetes sp.]
MNAFKLLVIVVSPAFLSSISFCRASSNLSVTPSNLFSILSISASLSAISLSILSSRSSILLLRLESASFRSSIYPGIVVLSST